MVHLLTGNLRGFSAARLRRRIARDPALTREWNELQAMTTRLQQTVMSQPQRPAPRWISPSTLDVSQAALREQLWKRRALTAIALTAPTLTLATAYGIWSIWSLPNATFVDKQGHVWKAHSTVRGEVRLYENDGKWIGSFASRPLFSPLSTSGNVHVSIDGRTVKPIRDTGTYEMRTEAGNDQVGYVQVVPEKDKVSITGGSTVSMSALYYGDALATDDVVGPGMLWSQLGLAGEVNRGSGLAWKLKGYASVTVRYYGGQRRANVNASQWLPSPSEANRWKTSLGTAPNHSVQPVLSYSIANQNLKYFRMPAGGFLFYKGHWVNPVQSGIFTGYGRHDVLDKKGKPVLTFDVQPLGPVAMPAARR